MNIKTDSYNEFYEKIDILITIEKTLYAFDELLGKRVVSTKEKNKKNLAIQKNIKSLFSEILEIFKEKKAYQNLLTADIIELEDYRLNFLDSLETDFIINNDFHMKLEEFGRFMKNQFHHDLGVYKHDSVYQEALRVYSLEKKSLYQEIELNELKNKVKDISFIDEKITSKNEFYNKRIENLLKIEDGFHNLLNYFDGLDVESFSKQDWKEIQSVKSNIRYIVDCFDERNIYRYFLLINDEYLDDLLNYVSYSTINNEHFDRLSEESLEFVKSFYEKVFNPVVFFNESNSGERMDTPLYSLNVNFYTMLKDYKKKGKLIEGSDLKIAQAIEKNGEYSAEIKKYIQNFKDKKVEFDTLVSNLFISKQLVEVAVKRIKANETFINEIEGLYINNETRKVYEDLYKDEVKIANRFRNVALSIYMLLGGFAATSLYLLLFSEKNSDWVIRLSDPDKLLIKIPLILTLIFIGIYFSREGDKHRRIANQARQTMKELHAFTSYSTDIQDKIPEIKIKLADKYFGKTLYESEKSGSTDTDIFKTLVEQTKVTTDLVKTLKSSMTPSTSNQDPGKGPSGTG